MSEPTGATCSAHSARTGAPCRKAPVNGARVCRTHGGSAPQVRAAALLRMEEQQVARRAGALVVAFGGERPDSDPVAHLLRLIQQSAMTEAALAQMLDREPEVIKDGPFGAYVVPEFRLWSEERDRLASLTEKAIKANIAERQVRMAEAQGHQIVQAVTRALEDAEWALSDEQRETGKSVIARHFRALVAA